MSATLAAVRLASCLKFNKRVITACMIVVFGDLLPMTKHTRRGGKRRVYLACEGGKASAMEWTPPSLGFLCNFVSAVKATPIKGKRLI